MIVTVTLNPAVDKILYLPSLKDGAVNRGTRVSTLPGGKGINIAVMLNKLGQEVRALGLLGGHTGEFVENTFERQGIFIGFEHVDGMTRNDLILVEPTGRITQLLEPGPRVSEADTDKLLVAYERSLGGCETVVIGGSLPPGAPVDIYKKLITIAKEKGVRTALNAYGPPFEAGIEAGPDIAKPDIRFKSEALGIDTSTPDGRQQIANGLFKSGIGTVVIAFGNVSHSIYSKEASFEISVPETVARNTVTAGDAFLAGLVHATLDGMAFREACAWAAAMEAAASQAFETRWAEPHVVDNFLEYVNIKELHEG